MRVTYYVAASLDGCIADGDGSVDWLDVVARPGEDYGYSDFIKDVDALAMGRATWDFVAGHIAATGESPYGRLPVRVFTHRPLTDPPPTVSSATGDPGAVVAALAEEGRSHLWVVGGGGLAGDFVRAGLLTDVIVSVIPVVVGGGPRLFGADPAPVHLEVLDVADYPSGLVQTHYRVVQADG